MALAFDRSGQVSGNSVGGPTVSGVGIVTDSSIEIVQYTGPSIRSSSVVIPSAPPDCKLLDTSDGVALGWLVGGVWLAVYAVRWLSKQIETERVEYDT